MKERVRRANKLSCQIGHPIQETIIISIHVDGIIDFIQQRANEPLWNVQDRILEEEQSGRDRADYGTYLIAGLASRLEPEFGSGFTKRQLERARQFYSTYPNASALRSQLNWTHYRTLIQISDPDKREYYELEAAKNFWTARELERQKNSLLYERLLKSSVPIFVEI